MYKAWRTRLESGLIIPQVSVGLPSMSAPIYIPPRSPPGSPASPGTKSPRTHFLLPSPIPTRRNRTQSMSERAMQGPTFTGQIKDFCREKGHGFVVPDDGSPLLFVHISDIDEEFVPHDGDRVEYKTILIPPKQEKMQAVHIRIITPVKGTLHERWDAPLRPVTPQKDNTS